MSESEYESSSSSSEEDGNQKVIQAAAAQGHRLKPKQSIKSKDSSKRRENERPPDSHRSKRRETRRQEHCEKLGIPYLPQDVRHGLEMERIEDRARSNGYSPDVKIQEDFRTQYRAYVRAEVSSRDDDRDNWRSMRWWRAREARPIEDVTTWWERTGRSRNIVPGADGELICWLCSKRWTEELQCAQPL